MFCKWIQISLSDTYTIRVGLFSIFSEEINQSYSIRYFQTFVCEKFFKTSNLQNNCVFLKNFYWAGVVSLLFMGIGVLAHLYVIFQIILILCDKYIGLKPKLCIRLRKLQLMNFFLYFISFIIWFLGSGCVYFDLNGLGLSFYLNAGSMIFYLLLLFYFLYLKKKIKEINRISGYLWH